MPTRSSSTVAGQLARVAAGVVLAVALVASLLGCSLAALFGAEESWSGEIRIERKGQDTVDTINDICCTETTRSAITDTIVITVIKGEAKSVTNYAYWEHTVAKISSEQAVHDVTRETVITGGAADTLDTAMKVSLEDNGAYYITYHTPPVKGTLERIERTQVTCRVVYKGCVPGVFPDAVRDEAAGLSGSGDTVEGRAASGSARRITGSETMPFGFGAGLEGTETVTWDLSR